MKPYYQDLHCTIYHGDCRDVLPQIEPVDAIITDPIWPDNSLPEYAEIDEYELFATAASFFSEKCKRAVIQLGCDSDPRFLLGMPKEMPYLRTNWLRFRPSYRGRLLIGSDVAYSFGEPPPARDKYILLSGECDIPTGPDATMMDVEKKKRERQHCCPRILGHLRYLVDKFTAPWETICDPFAGSGTTGLAAKELGRKSIMIEDKKNLCDVIIQRLKQEVMAL